MLPKYLSCFRICYCEFEVKASLHVPKLLKSLFALTEKGNYVQFVKKVKQNALSSISRNKFEKDSLFTPIFWRSSSSGVHVPAVHFELPNIIDCCKIIYNYKPWANYLAQPEFKFAILFYFIHLSPWY